MQNCEWGFELFDTGKWVLGVVGATALMLIVINPEKIISTFSIGIFLPVAASFSLLLFCWSGDSYYLVDIRSIAMAGQLAWLAAPLAYLGDYKGVKWMVRGAIGICILWFVITLLLIF